MNLGQWLQGVIGVTKHAIDTEQIAKEDGEQLVSVAIALVEAFEGAKRLCESQGRCKPKGQ